MDTHLAACDASEMDKAAQFLTNCSVTISRHIDSLYLGSFKKSEQSEPTSGHQALEPSCSSDCIMPSGQYPVPESSSSDISIATSDWKLDQRPCNQINYFVPSGLDLVPESSTSSIPISLHSDQVSESSRAFTSWANMVQEDELQSIEDQTKLRPGEEEERGGQRGERKMELSREQKELNRLRNVQRIKDFECLERVGRRFVNVVAGLELHTGVFSPIEQKRIVDFVYQLLDKGRNGELGERTYSAPAKWMRGKGRITMQFGCNYNYATDRDGNPPGIMRKVAADPMPDLFNTMIKRLLKWHVLPTKSIPDSCIVNIYEPEDCIPPHIDSHDFERPFCTVSFLSECNILFGRSIRVLGPGEFSGPLSIALPVGSVLVLNGNGADVAKHCVPGVPTKRISITFRKMKRAKWPVGFSRNSYLESVVPLCSDSSAAPDHKKHRSR